MTLKIKDLKSNMRNLTLIVKVVEKSQVVERRQKRYASAIVEDETGRIKLNLWREQVDQVKEGDVIRIPKAFIHIKGSTVQISTWSTIESMGARNTETRGE
jgi:ssDNA-binding replication factor A large subunit